MPHRQWPIFIISLEDAIERRNAITQQLDHLGMSATIFNAVDGRKGLSPEHEALVDRKKALERVGRNLSGGEFACALSHQAIYRHIIDAELPGAIILEDDAILSKNFASFVNKRGYLLGSLIQMDHLDARVKPISKIVFSPGVRLFKLAENASLTTGYSISAEAAHYILRESSPISGLADWPCNLMPISPLATLPRIIDHPNDEENSSLKRDRDAIKTSINTKSKRYLRFFKSNYWSRWIFKRMTRKIS